jgi:hypothetical protein
MILPGAILVPLYTKFDLEDKFASEKGEQLKLVGNFVIQDGRWVYSLYESVMNRQLFFLEEAPENHERIGIPSLCSNRLFVRLREQ